MHLDRVQPAPLCTVSHEDSLLHVSTLCRARSQQLAPKPVPRSSLYSPGMALLHSRSRPRITSHGLQAPRRIVVPVRYKRQNGRASNCSISPLIEPPPLPRKTKKEGAHFNGPPHSPRWAGICGAGMADDARRPLDAAEAPASEGPALAVQFRSVEARPVHHSTSAGEWLAQHSCTWVHALRARARSHSAADTAWLFAHELAACTCHAAFTRCELPVCKCVWHITCYMDYIHA